MIEMPGAETVMNGKGGHQMQLPGPQDKGAVVMPDLRPPVENQPQPGEWTDHILEIPPAPGIGALHRQNF